MKKYTEHSNLNFCDECGSSYYKESSEMLSLCPECSHYLYDYELCKHKFNDGRCIKCYWDGSTTEYIESLKTKMDNS